MGSPGSSADNASAESFFGVLKREIDHVIRQTTCAEATMHINDYMVNLHNARLRRTGWRVPSARRASSSVIDFEPDLWDALKTTNE